MKAFLGIVAVLIVGLLTTACQYKSPFVIANESDEPLEITCELRSEERWPEYRLIPAIQSIEEFSGSRWNLHWRNLRENEFSFDIQSGSVKFVIDPHTVLKIESKDLGLLNVNPKRFDVKRIVLNGSSRSVILEDESLYKQFEPDNRGWFFLGDYVFVIRYR